VPGPVARTLASALEPAWRALRIAGQPPITNTAVRLLGEEVTVRDAKARDVLGYRNEVEREGGLAEMRSMSNHE